MFLEDFLFDGEPLFAFKIVFFNHFGRIADGNSKGRDVFGDHRIGADSGVTANGDVFENRSFTAD